MKRFLAVFAALGVAVFGVLQLAQVGAMAFAREGVRQVVVMPGMEEVHQQVMIRGDVSSFHHSGYSSYGHHELMFMHLLSLIITILIGLLIRRTAGPRIWQKWIGNIMIFFTILPILPMILFFVAIACLFKLMRKSRQTTWVDAPSLYDLRSDNGNASILDEWEENIAKEEK